jgi:hypothetical protein
MEPDLVSKEHDEAQELVLLPEIVEPIVHCALERLSWWRIQPFFHNSGLFLRIFPRNFVKSSM